MDTLELKLDLSKLVIVESPFSGDVARNMKYVRAAMRDCFVNHGEYPIASHALYTQTGVLNDNEPLERQLGIDAGLVWGSFAKKTIVYPELGISRGMEFGIANAKKAGREIIYRELGPMWEDIHDQLVSACKSHPFLINNVRM